MKKYTFVWLLAGLLLLFSFALPTNAQDQTLSQWYDQWDQSFLGDMNREASAAYVNVTGTNRSVQELMNRNRYYWFWPDFVSAVQSMWGSDYDLACVTGQSSYYNGADVQSYYINTDDYRDIIATMFHENIHSDVDGWTDVSRALFIGREELLANGFELTSEDSLEYFDEAFVDILADLMMNEVGFTDFVAGGYAASTPILRPMVEKIMARGMTVQELYTIHTYSDIQTILLWIGTVILEEENIPYEAALAVSRGYDFALEVHRAQHESFYPPTEITPERRTTCEMWLWFSPDQYELYNLAYDFPSDVWHQNDWGNWRIVEEDYYAVIDQQ